MIIITVKITQDDNGKQEPLPSTPQSHHASDL